MGGRGTYAAGNMVTYTYETVGFINGVKILEPIDKTKMPKLPEEAHSSHAYIKLDKNGVFDQYREYNDKHELVLEIGFHAEPKVLKDKQNRPILHIHIYNPPGNFKNRWPRLLTESEFDRYKDYFEGISKTELERQLKLIKENSK